MPKAATTSAKFDLVIGAHKSVIMVRGDDFSTCFAAGDAACRAIKAVFVAAARSKKQQEQEAEAAKV